MEVSDSEAKVIDITEVRAEDQETAERILAGISEALLLKRPPLPRDLQSLRESWEERGE